MSSITPGQASTSNPIPSEIYTRATNHTLEPYQRRSSFLKRKNERPGDDANYGTVASTQFFFLFFVWYAERTKVVFDWATLVAQVAQ